MDGTGAGGPDGTADSEAPRDLADDATLTAEATSPADATSTSETSASSKPKLDASVRALLARGRSVGRYVVYEVLGVGGMGVVYKAFDPDLNRGVALKVLAVSTEAEGAATKARIRLEREAQALAQLSHPNVVAIHDVGRFDGDLFIAMELVEGQTLKQWRKATTRSWQDIVDVFCAAGSGLAAAHRSGLVHRDFKPSNVLVGDDGRVRVADFGLARATDSSSATVSASSGESHSREVPVESADESADELVNENTGTGLSRSSLVSAPLTRAGAIMGTPQYMAPEQYVGGTVDAAADQFSFCVSLYEALYGVRPFRGNTLMALQRRVMAGRVADPPSDVRVPTWLRKVVMRGLSVSPESRYPSMDVLLSALRSNPSVRRRRWVAAGVAVSLMLLLSIGWLRQSGSATPVCRDSPRWLSGVWDEAARAAVRLAWRGSGLPSAESIQRRVEQVLDVYARSWATAHRQTCEATHIHGVQSGELLDLKMGCLTRANHRVAALVAMLRRPPDMSMLHNAVSAAVSATDVSRCQDEAALRDTEAYPLPTDPQVRQRLDALEKRIDELTVMRDAGRYKEGVDAGEAIVAEADALGYAPAQAESMLLMGGLLSRSGDYERAEQVYARGIVLAARAGDDRRGALMAARRVFVVGNFLDRHDQALAMVPHVEAAVVRAGNFALARVNLLDAIGELQYARGDYDLALQSRQRCVSILEETVAADDLRLAFPLNNLGVMHYHKKNYDQAILNFVRARDIWQAALGPEHPSVGFALTNLGSAYADSGRLEQAFAAHHRALVLFESAHGPEHPNVAEVLASLGEVLEIQGKFSEAEARYRRALAIRENSLGRRHREVGFALSRVGSVLHKQGKFADSLVYYRRAVEACQASVGERHEQTGVALLGVGRAQLELGQSVAAAPTLERALEILGEKESSDVPAAQFNLARALAAQHRDRERARELAEKARAAWAQRLNSAADLSSVETWLAGHR